MDPDITAGAVQVDEHAFTFAVRPLCLTGLDGVILKLTQPGSKEMVEPATARRTHHRSSVVAEFDAVARRTGPLNGRVTRIIGSRPLERGEVAKIVSASSVRLKVHAGPSFSAVGHEVYKHLA